MEYTTVQEDMEDMFETAEQMGLWFFCRYQQLWFSPDELREAQLNGKFRWGSVNWELRNPREREDEIKREIEAKRMQLKTFQARY